MQIGIAIKKHYTCEINMNKNDQKLHSTLLTFKHTDWVTPSAAQPVNINMVTGAGFISLFRKAGVSLVAFGAWPIPMCTCIRSYFYSSRRTKQQYVKITVEHKLLRWNIWHWTSKFMMHRKDMSTRCRVSIPCGGLKSRTRCGWESSMGRDDANKRKECKNWCFFCLEI